MNKFYGKLHRIMHSCVDQFQLSATVMEQIDFNKL